ncbi:hypothetical protein [Peptoniphilus catoniae]|uniref:hypothetical protein n=1 Tax=Peptoniphilus catoniae TaxID=1660341 RepID=UPI0010FE8DD7|nr:hypothetical protein [Peptoniphilus catoniae]
MFKIFKSKSVNKSEEQESIYKMILRAEEENKIENLKLRHVESKDEDILKLEKALLDYYNKDRLAIEEFERYFKNHRLEDIKEKFERFIFSMDTLKEDKLVGLSILLMRDTTEPEAVKFGIFLANFYPLVNVRGAIKIITDLGAHEDFTKYSLSTLKQLEIYPVVRDNILRRGNDKVKDIEEKLNETWKK